MLLLCDTHTPFSADSFCSGNFRSLTSSTIPLDIWHFLVKIQVQVESIVLQPQNQLGLNINLCLSQKASTLTKLDVVGVKL